MTTAATTDVKRTRSPGAERRFLRGAVPASPAYTQLVEDRLAWANDQHGNTFARRTVAELLDEIGEECVDIGGWAALAVQRVSYDPHPQADRVAACLQELVRLAARQHRIVDLMHRLDRHGIDREPAEGEQEA